VRIIKGVEPIVVTHPVFLIFGQPGICKTSLGYSCKDPLLLDFDQGAHRAANRRDTLQIGSWPDVSELMQNSDVLAPYATVIPDTVGRCLDVMTADIAVTDPKKAPGGNLSQQGWGVLKNRFRSWTSQLRALGKDVLLLAHDKEDKDGDTRIVRPDIIGGSYGEVMKVADFVGYLYMAGKDRVLDFSPTDRWVGKNPGGWTPFKVPPVGKAQTFMAELFDRGREALGTISDESAKVMQNVEDWRANIATFTTPDEINRAIPEAKKLPAISAPQVKKLLMDRATALGFAWDPGKNCFVERATATV
jgi:AAA domain